MSSTNPNSTATPATNAQAPTGGMIHFITLKDGDEQVIRFHVPLVALNRFSGVGKVWFQELLNNPTSLHTRKIEDRGEVTPPLAASGRVLDWMGNNQNNNEELPHIVPRDEVIAPPAAMGLLAFACNIRLEPKAILDGLEEAVYRSFVGPINRNTVTKGYLVLLFQYFLSENHPIIDRVMNKLAAHYNHQQPLGTVRKGIMDVIKAAKVDEPEIGRMWGIVAFDQLQRMGQQQQGGPQQQQGASQQQQGASQQQQGGPQQ